MKLEKWPDKYSRCTYEVFKSLDSDSISTVGALFLYTRCTSEVSFSNHVSVLGLGLFQAFPRTHQWAAK